jgi:hypothetical protein
MKLMILAAAAALTMLGQAPNTPAAKVAPDVKAATPAITERAPSKDEILEYRATLAEIKNLRTVYKIDEFNQKVQPKVSEQQKLFADMCRSVGVPEEKITPTVGQTECGLNMGVDDDGNPLKGADGKPISAKVWWAKPAPASAAVAPTK